MPVRTTLPYTFKTAFDTSITRHLDKEDPWTTLSLEERWRDFDIEVYEEEFEKIKHLHHPVYLLTRPFAKKIHPDLQIIYRRFLWIMCFPKEYLKPEINVATMLKVSRWLKKYDAIQIK
jgi:hypothetical protein